MILYQSLLFIGTAISDIRNYIQYTYMVYAYACIASIVSYLAFVILQAFIHLVSLLY